MLFISHFNKNGNGRALSRLTDSLAFGALARCGWLVMGEEKQGVPTGRKLFLRGKNNLAAGVGGLAYRIGERTIDPGNGHDPINVPHVEWLGPVNITADEALASSGTKPSALDAAMTFLGDVLENGPLPQAEVRERAEADGHSWATVRRAKAALGVASVRDRFTAGGWLWTLPGQDDDERAGTG